MLWNKAKKTRIPGLLAILFLSVLIAGSALTVVTLVSIPYYGYEGAYVYFYGMKTNNEYYDLQGKVPNPIVYYYGQPIPVYNDGSTPATWDWSMQNLNLDPYAFDDYWCNLIVETSGNGQFERTVFGTYRTDQVRWVNPTTYDGETATKMTEATIYYADVDIDLNTQVDETLFAGIPIHTEKDDYWKATDILTWVHLQDWYNLPGTEGNLTNWSSILGVEVVSVEKVQGKGEIVDFSFNSGDMLVMYRNWGEFISNSPVSPSEGPDLIASLQQTQPSSVPVETRQDVAVSLHFNKFGNAGSDPWLEPYYHVVLRVHILKVGEWVVTQQVSEPWTPKEDTRPEGWYAMLLDWIGNPLNQLLLLFGGGLLGVVVVFVLLAIFAPSVLILMYVAIKNRKKKGRRR